MDLLELMRQRRSVRAFKQQAMPETILNQIKQAGRLAATSRNKQARRFVLVTDDQLKAQLQQEAKMQDFVKGAGVLMVGVATNKESLGSVYDVIISMTQMEMVAVSQGLGTCWLGVYDAEVAAKLLGIPDDAKIASMMAIGYPADEDSRKEKLPEEELFSYNRYR